MKLVWPRKKGIKYLIGIDEVGRGPLAGPVTVGFFILEKRDISKLKKMMEDTKLKDSKELKEEEREGWLGLIKSLKLKIKSYLTVSMSAKQIDKYGIAVCIRKSIEKGLRKINIKEKETFVLLDGSLKAPERFSQKTIIKGDTKEPVIALASIVAKVNRDTYMKRISKKYPEYDFHIHKGYGTERHREAIKKYGLCGEHREGFCKKLRNQRSENKY